MLIGITAFYYSFTEPSHHSSLQFNMVAYGFYDRKKKGISDY